MAGRATGRGRVSRNEVTQRDTPATIRTSEIVMDKLEWNVNRRRLTDTVAGLDGRLLLAIGVGSGAEARALHHALTDVEEAGAVPDYVGGFVYFVSGYLCAAAHGLPDLGYILRGEIVRQTDIIEQATWMAALDRGNEAHPLGVDIDTGYGTEPSAVALTCRQVHKQGAAYVQIEDQHSINKSCGHMAGSRGEGKKVVDAAEMIATRLAPALAYAGAQEDLLVAARTDALSSLGIDEAIERAIAYADAGAQIVFVEAPESEEQLARIGADLAGSSALNVANMVEGSPRTPYLSPRRTHELGFDIALYPIGALLTGHEAATRYFDALVRGRPGEAGPGAETCFTDFNQVIGGEQTERWNRFFD